MIEDVCAGLNYLELIGLKLIELELIALKRVIAGIVLRMLGRAGHF